MTFIREELENLSLDLELEAHGLRHALDQVDFVLKLRQHFCVGQQLHAQARQALAKALEQVRRLFATNRVFVRETRAQRAFDPVSDEARNDRPIHAIGHGKIAEQEAALRAIFSQRDFPRIQDASDLLLGGIT